jgi:catechol 2,3-dioxygenase-like lactoylglutathione lyase family enzyme
MIDHVGFAVSDAGASKRFYEAALAPLGITLLMTVPAEENDSGGTAYGFGDDNPFFWVGDNERVGRGRMWPSAPIRATRSMLSTRPRWRRAVGTMAGRGCGRTTGRTITPPLPMIPTA